MEDFSRCYAVPPLSSAISPTDAIPSYDNVISQLSSQCWAYYENSGHRHSHSLYLGSLGPCAYVRYCLAQSLSWVDDKENKLQLLNAAAAAVDNVLFESSTSGCRQRITLLEGVSRELSLFIWLIEMYKLTLIAFTGSCWCTSTVGCNTLFTPNSVW